MRNCELRTAALALAVGTCLTLGGACTGVGSPGFDDQLRRYNQYVRWSDFKRASQFVAPESQADFRARGDALSNVRFTDYDVRKFDVDPEKEEAHVEVYYTAYHTHRLVETAFVEEQEWTRDAETGAWRVESVLREQPADSGSPF